MWGYNEAHEASGASRSGFTIVELLIVIIVIAILVVITVVAYTSITNQAKISSVKFNIEHVGKKLTAYKTQNADSYLANKTLAEAQVGMTLAKYLVNAVSPPVNYCAVRWGILGKLLSSTDTHEYRKRFKLSY